MPIRICDVRGPVLAKMLGESDVEGVSGCGEAYVEEYQDQKTRHGGGRLYITVDYNGSDRNRRANDMKQPS
jgi:hypothetical protein